jgi:hypothetical protein
MTKAFTRASKRRRKGGRPRIEGAIREPSGKIYYGKAEDARRAETMTETATEARQRVFGVSKADAGTQEAGSVLGRLYLDGKLGPVLKEKGTSWFRLEAGNRYAMDMARYYMLTGIPHPCPKAQNVLAVRGDDGDVSEERAASARKASNRMMSLEMCLGVADTQGRPVTSSVKSVCIMETETARGWHESQLRHLVRGLDALVKYYGLDGK